MAIHHLLEVKIKATGSNERVPAEIVERRLEISGGISKSAICEKAVLGDKNSGDTKLYLFLDSISSHPFKYLIGYENPNFPCGSDIVADETEDTGLGLMLFGCVVLVFSEDMEELPSSTTEMVMRLPLCPDEYTLRTSPAFETGSFSLTGFLKLSVSHKDCDSKPGWGP
ncbi:hypothetical protein OGATHE_005263 [Ogataea polymorpha]|uniref:Uncharacterized protein n=1 Tax=Ogataea polymorpha TaxID=460523 RepID=A0A9P8SZZ9_9ASCO|nr:hypothetical protein OGATHE_005263 [Ogataea polymorpha]